MPEALERQGEGYVAHLGAKPGTERYNRIKYGTMRKKGWRPGHKTVLGQRHK
jgi:hypothetical protein